MGKPIKGKSLEEHTLPGEVWRRLDDKWEGLSHHYFSNFGRLYGTQRWRLLTLTSEGCFQLKHPGGTKKVSPSTLMRTFFPYEWIKDLDDDEEVRPIKGHPDFFITTKGKVFSWRSYSWLQPHPQLPYYWSVGLGKKRRLVHQLVGRNFFPEWKEGLWVLHKDEELPFPEINFLSNLWVGTQEDNERDKRDKGRLVSPFVKGHKLWDKWFSEGKTNRPNVL